MIAAVAAQALALAGALYDTAGYLGTVDAGIAIVGLRRGISADRFGQGMNRVDHPTPYDSDDYRRTQRFSAIGLVADPRTPAGRLVDPLLRATIGAGHEEIVKRFKP